MFIKRDYNRWYYSIFTEQQKERVRRWREKHKEDIEKKPKKKEHIPITIQRGAFIVFFN